MANFLLEQVVNPPGRSMAERSVPGYQVAPRPVAPHGTATSRQILEASRDRPVEI